MGNLLLYLKDPAQGLCYDIDTYAYSEALSRDTNGPKVIKLSHDQLEVRPLFYLHTYLQIYAVELDPSAGRSLFVLTLHIYL